MTRRHGLINALNEMNTSRIGRLLAVIVSVSVVSVAYSQTAPKDVLPPTSVARPPVSPTLNVLTPDNVAVPSATPIAITPQAPAAPTQSVPQLAVPAVVGTNRPEAAANGQATDPGKPSSVWTQTNAAPSAWGKTGTAVGSTLPSAAKAAPDLWSKPPPNTRLWDSTMPLGSSGTKTDWK